MRFHRILSVFLIFVCSALLLTPVSYALDPIEVNAQAALLVDTAEETVLYSKNEHKKMYPASITKVMTALLVMEAVDRGELSFDQMVTASESAISSIPWYGSSADIKAGEQMRLKDLMYCILLASANEACNIAAEVTAGSISAFVARMNQRAQELGCTNTHFVNPHGLHDPNHYTSAWDIYLMGQEVLKSETLMTICNALSYTVPATNMSAARELHTTNSLISNWRIIGYLYQGAEGIKTGNTTEAGHCLLSSAVRNGRRLMCVVLGCDGSGAEIHSFSDSAALYDYGFNNFTTKSILSSNDLIAEVPVELSKETNYVVVHPATDAKTILPNDVDPASLERTITLTNEVAFAPVTKGQVLGEITLSFEGRVCASVPLLAQYDVGASKFLTAKYQVEQFFAQTIVKIALVVLVLLVAAIVIWWKFFRRKRRYGNSSRRSRRSRSYRGRRR